ncbi:MAG: alginate export family protein [Deltaproteobacteria bacterium]|nr:alginate export family protein [Deltaproteobacteria bacterium]
MTMSFALVALLAAADPAPAAETPPPAPEAPKVEAPAAPEAPKAEAPAAPAAPASPATAAAPEAPAAPPPAAPAEAAKPKEEKLKLVMGDLSFAPRAMLRVRAEMIGDRTLNSLPPASVIAHRARGGFDAEWKDTAKLVFESHHTRGWGAEQTAAPPAPQDVTVFGKVANSVDLHQGYVGLFVGPTEIRVGRQEIIFTNERVLGLGDWGMTGRSYDAIRLSNRAAGDFNYMGFCSMVRDIDHVPTMTVPSLALCAVGVEHKLMPAFRYAPVALVELTDAANLVQRTTLGARFDGSVGGFSYDVDLYGQPSWVGTDVKFAFLAGARAAYEVDTMMKPKVGLALDYVSGGAPDAGDVVTFDTTWGTNHKFYGWQDFFTNLPVHTLNQGLMDAAVNLNLKEGPFSAQLAVHAFAPTAYTGDGTGFYGIEPDLVARYAMTSWLNLDVGGAVFIPVGDALGRGDDGFAPWAFTAIEAKL